MKQLFVFLATLILLGATANCHETGNPRHVNPHPYPWMGNITADDMMQDTVGYDFNEDDDWGIPAPEFNTMRGFEHEHKMSWPEDWLVYITIIKKEEIYV